MSEKGIIRYDLEFIKQIPLEQILADYGIAVRNGFFKTRAENTASCKLYHETNTWSDFGGAAELRGGGPSQLVSAITGMKWKEAVSELGERYNAPVLQGEKQSNNNKAIGDAQYTLIGIAARPAYANILKPEYADYFSYEHIQNYRQNFDISMNELHTKDPNTYAAIIKSEAIPFMRDFHTEYLRQLHILRETELDNGSGSRTHQAIKHITDEVAKDYQVAYKVLEKAVKGTDMDIAKMRPDYEKDYATIQKKSIEIGVYPYSQLKQQSGQLHHIKCSYADYRTFSNAVVNEELAVPRFAAHVKDQTVTLSCRPQDANTFRGIMSSIGAMAQMVNQKTMPHSPAYQAGQQHGMEMG